MATREHRRNKLRDIRIGLGRKGVLMQGQRSGGQITGKAKRALRCVKRSHNTSAQPTRQTQQARQTNQSALGLIGIRRSGKVLDVVRDLMQHGIGQTGGRLSSAAHQLNALTHRNAARRMQVEHLKGRDAKRHANTRRDFFGLIEKLVKQFVQNACVAATPSAKRAANAESRWSMALAVARAESTSRAYMPRRSASISTSSASLRAGESLLMTKHPTSDWHPADRQPRQKQP